MKKKEIVKNIDHQLDRIYELENKKELTEEEVRELKGRSVKIAFLKLNGLSGMSLKEYLSLTDRYWGDKAQKTGISLCYDGCGEMTKTDEDCNCIKCGEGK